MYMYILVSVCQGDINDLTETEAKGFLLLVAERQPYLVCDIMGVTSGRRDEPPRDPARAESTPDWCVCTRCRDMGQDVEKLCCNMQPENCLSVRPVSDHYCFLELSVLKVPGIQRYIANKICCMKYQQHMLYQVSSSTSKNVCTYKTISRTYMASVTKISFVTYNAQDTLRLLDIPRTVVSLL